MMRMSKNPFSGLLHDKRHPKRKAAARDVTEERIFIDFTISYEDAVRTALERAESTGEGYELAGFRLHGRTADGLMTVPL